MKSNIQNLLPTTKTTNFDHFILPNSDEFFLEYLPNDQKRIQFLTGFSGSNATLLLNVVGQNHHQFFTDGRYILQAKNQLSPDEFDIIDIAQTPLLSWLEANLGQGKQIAINPELFSVSFVEKLQEILTKKSCKLIFLEEDLVAKIWKNRPKPANSTVFEHKLKFAGQSRAKKIHELLTNSSLLTGSDPARSLNPSTAILISNPESICWLFNIRAADVDFAPLLACYAIIYRNQKPQIFLDEKRVGDKKFLAKLKREIDLIHPKKMRQELQKNANKNFAIQIDPSQTNQAIYQFLLEQNFQIIKAQNPILIKKAIKNKAEIKNAIKAHEIDGLAVTKFLFWLENSAKNGEKIDELSAEKKILEFRAKSRHFLYPSFNTISSFAQNGAIIHYAANKKTNKKIGGNSLYLIDSGGQYFQGTTDVTRTIAIGTPSAEMKHNFTLVLKGHIALASAIFNEETTSDQLDFLARQFLQKENKDYAHGTGHGVGSFLSVHESPPSISKRAQKSTLQSGMILSNEPGFYQENHYGIRIENLILVKKIKASLCFETLTLAPIDKNLIEEEILSKEEKNWLKNYHKKVFSRLEKKLNKSQKAWLSSLSKFYKNF